MYKLGPWDRVRPCRIEDFCTGLISATCTGWEPESSHFPAVCCVCEVATRRGDGAGSVTHCETALGVVVYKILLRTVYLESRPFRCGIFYNFVLI